MHHRATLNDSIYRSLGKNTSPNTGKNVALKTLAEMKAQRGREELG